MDANFNAQGGGAAGQAGNKKNKKKKKSKNLGGSDTSGTVSSESPSGNMDNGARHPHPHPRAPQRPGGQLVVNVDRGNRNVSEVQAQDSSKPRERQQQQRGQDYSRDNDNNNANNSARYRDRGNRKPERKGNRQQFVDKERQQEKAPSVSHKGSFVSLQGKELLRNLAEHRIFELKKKNPSFPNAKYFCRLCEYHLDRPQDCERHVDESRHQRKKEALDMEGILENIPQPNRQQVRALDSVVEAVVRREGLSPSQLQVRQGAVSRLQAFVSKFTDDMTLRLYGSSLTGVGMKSSDINVDVSGPGPTPDLLINLFNILKKNRAPDFNNAQNNFSAKIPVVEVTDKKTGCKLVLTINGQAAVLTSTLLQLYSSADPRVTPLVVTFRTWARICHLDRQEEGTLPPFAFNVMLVYFLVQVQPPVLCLLPLRKNPPEGKGLPPLNMEDKLDEEALKSQAEAWMSQNKSSVGELWLQLLRFYCLEFDNTQFVISLLQTEPLTRLEKKWSSKKLAIEDPFTPKKNISNSLANSLIFEYYQSCVRKAYEYFGMPRDKDGQVNVCLENLKALASQKTETLLNENQDSPSTTTSPGSGSAPSSSSSVKAREKSAETAEENDDDESDAERESESDVTNASLVIESNKFIFEKLASLAGRETTPDKTAAAATSTGVEASPSPSSRVAVSSPDGSASGERKATADSCVDEGLADSVLSSSEQRTDSVSAGLDLTLDSLSVVSNSAVMADQSELDLAASSTPDASKVQPRADASASKEYFSALDLTEAASSDEYETSPESPDGKADPASTLPKEMGQLKISGQEAAPQEGLMAGETAASDAEEDGSADWYSFTENVFTGGKGPAVICGYCEQEGHIKANCPEDRLPLVLPLPSMTRDHLAVLDKVIAQIIYDFAPSELDVMKRQRAVKDLENFIQQIYPDAQLSLFGSSCNGFGFRHSDLDICMTFRGKTVEDIDVADVIEKVAKKLMQKSRQYYNVLSIPTAKVPIVKFTEGDTRLEGDISLYNTLAQCNTRLLWCYSEIDKRVKMLGYAIKVFAKICDIGDASRGSLSSYGYILMMLHYLQQCQPPVIPILQELRPTKDEGKPKPEVLVEGCNTWFFDNLRSLPQVWRECGRNRQGLGDLWVGFLRYYLETFDWKTHVVSIRQLSPLTKFAKMWNGNTIAVEDPFDLTHNLGGGLSRKMNNYIFKTFVKGRMHFGTPYHYNKDLHRYRNPSEYFFDTNLLMDGKPPNDRGCRLCGKIGHLVKDCPNRSQNRKRQQNQNDKDAKDGGKGQQESQSQKKKTSQDAKGQAAAAPKTQNQSSNNQVKGQNKDGKEQHRAGDRELKEPESKSQKERKDWKSKGAEKQGDSRAVGAGRAGKDLDDKQSQNQASSRPESGAKEKKNPEKKEKVLQSQPSSDGKGTATSTSTSTAQAGANAGKVRTTSGRDGDVSQHRVPPPSSSSTTTTTTAATAAFSSTPHRQPDSAPPHRGDVVLPSPVLAVGNPPSRSHPPSSSSTTSTPAQSSGMTSSPGVQMDVQQLFSMAQRSGGQSLSLLAEQRDKPTRVPPGVPSRQLRLTPEQQVAMLGTRSPGRGGHSTGSGPEPGQGGAFPRSPRATPERKTPVSVTALFQTHSSMPPKVSNSSPQQMMPMPIKTLFPPSPQSVPPTSQTPTSGVPLMPPTTKNACATDTQPRMPLPLQPLFHSQPGAPSALSPSMTPPPPAHSVPGPQQMTPLKALLPSQPPRPLGGPARGVESRPEHHPKQPLSLRYLFQATSSQQQQQMMLQQQQQQMMQHQQQMMLQQQQQQQPLQSPAQLQQAQQHYMHSMMQQFQEQKQTGAASPGIHTQSAPSQYPAHGGAKSHPPGFQSKPFTATPMSLSPSSHGQPDRGGQHQGSADRGQEGSLPSGFPPATPQHTATPHHSMPAFMQTPPMAVPQSQAVHNSQQLTSSPSQTLSSSPLRFMHPHPHHPMQLASRQGEQGSPSHTEGGPPGFHIQPGFSQTMPQQIQPLPVVQSFEGDPAHSPVSSSAADPFTMQQQQQMAFMHHQQQQFMLQQQQHHQQQMAMGASPQGMVGYGQAVVPGQAPPGMLQQPFFPSQIAPQGIQRERQNSSSSPDTTG